MRIVGLDLNHKINPLFKHEKPPDGSISVITAGVAESALLDNKNPRENALFCSI